jgi:hypothetical protein
MTYRGTVKDGVIVLEPGAKLAEGTEVRVDPVEEVDDDVKSLREMLLKYSGIIKGGPRDFARNHDHYLHGTPKK